MPAETTQEALFNGVNPVLEAIEKSVFKFILDELAQTNPGRDRTKCDAIFGHYTHQYLAPCISAHLASRVAYVGAHTLIKRVLELEKQLGTEFHKGALFYDTALAYLMSGNEDGYENFLAMTDEEEARIPGGAHQRGRTNLKTAGLAQQTVISRMDFACAFLNGQFANSPIDFAFITGLAPVSRSRFDAWRQNLDALHQFELLRIIHDIEVFRGDFYSEYEAAVDNPFIMLRLAKALSHLAQWVESCLSHWQGGASKGTLSPKLIGDPDFGASLSATAGGQDKFAGSCPQGPSIDAELRQLLGDLAGASPGPARHWRLLRILYIVRNATAHTIDAQLAIYNDRPFLLSLLQVVAVSVFAIAQLKRKTLP